MARRPILPIKTGLAKLHEDRCDSIYDGMHKRLCAERKNDRGQIIRVGTELPFTRYEFRAFVLQFFGGNADRCEQCHYCRRWIDVGTFVADHAEPVSLGGALTLDNIRLCCEECNLLKGKMREATFLLFLQWSITIPSDERSDIYSRLKNGGGYLRMKIFAQRKARAQRQSLGTPPPLFTRR